MPELPNPPAFWLKCVIAMSVAGAIVAVIIVVEYLNFTGFCYTDKRYHSDQELTDFAITRALEFGKDTDSPEEPKIYRSIDEFHEVNPDCCVLYKWGHPGQEEGIWVRIFGWYISVAEISYLNKTSGQERFYQAEVYMSACGEIKRIGGRRLSRLPTVK
jgi:hypothetical protein